MDENAMGKERPNQGMLIGSLSVIAVGMIASEVFGYHAIGPPLIFFALAGGLLVEFAINVRRNPMGLKEG